MTLRQLIEKRGARQSVLSKKLRMSPAAVSLMAAGLRMPSPAVASKLGRELRAQPIATNDGFSWRLDEARQTNAEYFSPFDRVLAIRDRCKFRTLGRRLVARGVLDDDDRTAIREVHARCRGGVSSPYLSALLRLANTRRKT